MPRFMPLLLIAAAALALLAPAAPAACCYFAAKEKDILQPAQKAFLTWDPVEKVETFTVQPRFEGNALDFGMVIPTPSQPKLHEMPRDFFKALAVFTTPKRRAFPESKLMPRLFPAGGGPFGAPRGVEKADGRGAPPAEIEKTSVEVLEVGQVGNLDY